MNLLERRAVDTIDPRLSVKLRGLKLQLQRDRLRDVVRRFVRPGQSVLDIGANRGVYTWMMSRQVGPDGRVHSFEPYPGNVDRLTTLVDEQTQDQRTSGGAVRTVTGESNSAGVPRYHRMAIDALASLRAGIDDDSVPVQVQKRRLDSLMQCEEQALSFVKCDVEGHEDEVVDGGWRIIERHRPALAIEIE